VVKTGFCGHNVFEADKLTIRRPNGSGDFLFLLLFTPFNIYQEPPANRAPITTLPNACILFPPDKHHHYQAVDTFKNSFIHFTPDYDLPSVYKIPTGAVIYPKKHETINQYIRSIVFETANKNPHYERKIGCLIEQLLIELSRELHSAEPGIHNTPLYSQFQRIRNSLISNCEADWTIESICKPAHMEKSQFYSLYSSFFNTTPKADILNARIERAKYLLTNQELQVYQVAEMCGFKSVSHFTRYFKKRNLCTPTEYIKESI